VTILVSLRLGDVEVEVIGGDPGAAVHSALVLLHEGLGSLELWRDVPAVLASMTGRQVVVWSRHGYGRSAAVNGTRRPTYMHEEALYVLPEFLDRLAIDRPILIGHSDGASIALIQAGAAIRPVAGVVAVAPHVLVEDHSLTGIRAARDEYLRGDLATRMGRYHDDPDATFWGWNDIWLSDSFRAWNIEACLPAITCPVLLVQCADDQYGTLDQLERIERQVAGPVERLVLPDGGHAPHLSHPEAVATRIATFVSSLT
jgi:pimeloyl-ACP methyl ester carboxylesterase